MPGEQGPTPSCSSLPAPSPPPPRQVILRALFSAVAVVWNILRVSRKVSASVLAHLRAVVAPRRPAAPAGLSPQPQTLRLAPRRSPGVCDSRWPECQTPPSPLGGVTLMVK